MPVLRLLASACCAVVACTSCGERAAPERPGVIDENAGTYRGVGLGMRVERLWEVFGKKAAAGPNESVGPLAEDEAHFRGPPYMQIVPASERATSFQTYRYEYASFAVANGTVRGVWIVEPGARTTRGVAIGEPLEAADRAYDVSCGTANEDTEWEPFPACSARLSPKRQIWFGGDPIATITLAVERFEGPSEAR